MADPLSELRSAIVRGDDLKTDASSIIVDVDKRLDRKATTNFHSRRGRGEPYSLEAVFFQYKHSDLPYNDYVKECAAERVSHVLLVDKKDLVAYIKGEISDCASLVAAKATVVTVGDVAQQRDDGPGISGAVDRTTAGGASRSEPADSPGKLAGDPRHRAATADRDQRCLDAVLCAENWDFSALRDKLTKHMELSRANGGSAKAKPSGGREAKAFDPRGDRYTATDDRFYRENMGADFFEHGIDPKGSFKKAAPNNGVQAAVPRPAGQKADSGSVPTTSPAPGAREAKDFATPASGMRRSAPASRQAPPAKRSRGELKTALRDQVPIIIVPSAAGSMLTFHNAKEFLENGAYVSMKEVRARGSMSTAATSTLTVRRAPGGSAVAAKYEVVCNPTKLTTSEWDRVVGVVCTGQLWQFKNWRDWEPDKAKKPDNGLSDIFRSMCGFVFHFDDTEPPRHMDNWAVKFLPVSRTLRHTDVKIQMRFWESIDAHCRLHKKNLLY
jgi:hypothetical protein